MISAEYLRTLARYNRWQNDNLVQAADGLGEAARRADGGAFFGSIFGTFNHLLWADRMWMSRLAGLPKPAKPLTESVSETQDWDSFKTARLETDEVISAWADGLRDGDLAGSLSWYSRSAGRELSQPLWLLATHVFNHQTHHRGQIHALLTAAGAKPGATDLPFMTAA